MRILICDDDEIITEQLLKYVREYFSKNRLSAPQIATFLSGEALLADTGEKDIVFLDVEMPGISGILTGKKLKEKNPHLIVFIVTAFAEYLDEAMRFHVFRYLSKPIDRQRLFRNMKDALVLFYAVKKKILVETKEEIHSVYTNEIVFVESQDRKVTVHTVDTDYAAIHPMNYWAEALDMSCFFQTHRSFIVNLEYVTDFDRTLVRLYHRQFSAYLARRKYAQFKSAYMQYLENTQ